MKTTLATLRKHAAKGDHLNAGYNTKNPGTRYETRTPIVYGFGDPFPYSTQNAGDIDRNQVYTGWYTSDDCDTGTIRGVVVTLPPVPGFPDGRFIAGTVDSDSGACVFFLDVYSEALDAARAADSEAERAAEAECDHNREWQAARDLEDKTEENETRLRECLALRHHTCMEYVRDEARKLCATIRKSRETLRYAGVL